MRLLLAFLLALSSHAHAAEIFVIGGALSTTAQLRSCYPNFNVAGIAQGASLRPALLKALQSSDGAVLAGHSNGWSKVVLPLSNSIPPELRAKLTLVNLDGGSGRAGKGFRRVRCVNAKNASGGTSRNFGGTAGSCSEPMTIRNANAGAGWALHFAVMNAAVPSNLCGPDSLRGAAPPSCWWGYHGFDNCRPVTDWARP